MSRRTPPTGPAAGRANEETDAPLVPDLGSRPDRTDTPTDRTNRTDRTDTSTDDPTVAATRRDRAERRRRRDPFELALMEDSE